MDEESTDKPILYDNLSLKDASKQILLDIVIGLGITVLLGTIGTILVVFASESNNIFIYIIGGGAGLLILAVAIFKFALPTIRRIFYLPIRIGKTAIRNHRKGTYFFAFALPIVISLSFWIFLRKFDAILIGIFITIPISIIIILAATESAAKPEPIVATDMKYTYSERKVNSDGNFIDVNGNIGESRAERSARELKEMENQK